MTEGADPDWFVASVAVVLIALALRTFWEGIKVLRDGTRAGPAADTALGES